MPPRVKICGVTSVEDALACADAGADAIGVNFWPGSKRRCELDVAERIARAVGDRVRVVAVFVDAPLEEIARVREATGIAWVQLHGREPASMIEALSPCAYKAVRPTSELDVREALALPGDELLVDASVPGVPGGTGRTCDWSLAARLSRARRVWLAGGLRAENVADAVRAVRPYGVDVASGVERSAGVKDHALVRAFVRAARGIAGA
ncbi:MAG TPA: phosphoribosylanthranilate isomerase [Sandaracinaceae bacterium]